MDVKIRYITDAIFSFKYVLTASFLFFAAACGGAIRLLRANNDYQVKACIVVEDTASFVSGSTLIIFIFKTKLTLDEVRQEAVVQNDIALNIEYH